MKKSNSYEDITSTIVTALQNEHNELFARTRSIDTRASILVSILLAILPFYFEILDWSAIRASLTNTCITFKEILMILCLFLSLVILIISLILCVLVICCRIYHTFPSDNYIGFNIKEYISIKATLNEINTSLIGSYTECIRINTLTVNKKAKKFIFAIIFTSLFVLFVSSKVKVSSAKTTKNRKTKKTAFFVDVTFANFHTVLLIGQKWRKTPGGRPFL